MSAPVATETVRLELNGLDCADCARTVETSLAAMPGVERAAVSFAGGTAEVAFDPARTDVSALASRVRSLGYGAREAAGGAWLFDLAGLDCGDCARTVEAGVRLLPGVGEANVNFGSATLRVVPRADSALTAADVVAAVAAAGYRASPRREGTAPTAGRWWRERRIVEVAVATALWVAGFAAERLGAPPAVVAAAYLPAMVLAGYPVVRAAWFALRARRADMNLLMTIAALGAVAIGEWEEGASVLILFAIGLTLQALTVERTRRAIRGLMTLVPAEATVVRPEGERRVPVAEVAVGELVVVRPGERVPVDGEVVAGRSAVDQAPITGESVPVAVEPGSGVFAGTINGHGALRVRSTKPAGDTTLARIIHLVEEAQASRAPTQALVDRFAAVYTPAVVGLAILLATVVPLLTGDFAGWFERALILLVVACPCALVISTPVALVAAIGAASRRGVLFKGGAAIEALAAVRTVAFDKTGTLTAGRPAVVDVIALDGRTPDDLLARAAAVERRATHPLGRAIVAAATERELSLPVASGDRAIPGLGAAATIDGGEFLVGSSRLFAGSLGSETDAALGAAEDAGQTAVLVGTAERPEGIVVLSDHLRPDGVATVAALYALGLRTVMLTGDNRRTAARIAAAAGVDDVRAELLPEEKVAAVDDLGRSGPVAMIGDGINDAPALATAAVGVAMGVAGSDAALEAADVALVRDDLAELPVAIRLARRTLRTIRQNIAVSLVVKAAFLLLTFAGVTTLWLAVLADMGTSLLVTANALLLLRVAAPDPPRENDPLRH
jgi:Cd2+/Zn2+-exporting ATPase